MLQALRSTTRQANTALWRRSPIRHNPLRSAYSSVATSFNAKVTKLHNGLTVASEIIPGAQTATVGVWIDAGSRAETTQNNGTAHFLEHLAFKGTKHRTQQQLELEIENMGGHLNAYTSRENTVYYAKSFGEDLPRAVEILSDILRGSKLEKHAIERERDVIIRESEEVDKQYEEVVFDHLHAVAFKEQALGRTILGPKENILSIQRTDLVKYITNNYKADRMVLVGTGAIEHEQLEQLADKYFGDLPASDIPVVFGAPKASPEDLTKHSKPTFFGAQTRLKDNTLSVAHIAIAVEGVSWSDPDYFTALVAQAIIGNWDRALGSAVHQGSRLSSVMSSNNLANSFMSFSTSYSDTGLWGIYLTTEKTDDIDNLVKSTLTEWNRLSTTVSQDEVERAKAQLKASLLLSLDGTTAIAEDIGRQIVTTGHRMTPEEVETRVESVTDADVRAWARKALNDRDIAIAGVGPIDEFLDYNQIRRDAKINAN